MSSYPLALTLSTKQSKLTEFGQRNGNLAISLENSHDPIVGVRSRSIADPTCFYTIAGNRSDFVESLAAPKPRPTNDPPPHPIDPYGSRMSLTLQAVDDENPTTHARSYKFK